MIPQTDIVLCATADWDNPTWTNKQHMACELARRGCRVLYVESVGLRCPSLRSSWDLARMLRRLGKAVSPIRQVRERIWVLSPLLIPFHRHGWVRALNAFLLRHGLSSGMRQLEFERPLVWTYHPLIEPLLRSLPQAPVVYHCVDDLAAAPHLPGELLRQAERKLLARCDVVFATSRLLQRHCERDKSCDVHYLPNVVDFAHFSQACSAGPVPADLCAIPKPRIGFIGAISEYKVDFALLREVARRRPDWHLVLLGQVGEGQPDTRAGTLKRPNIHLLGPKPYSELPAYLRGFDVATLPAVANDYTRAMFPMKFFEYLAAGRPVVACNTPALAEFRSAFWQADADPDAVIAAIAAALADPGERCAMGLELARKFTWTWRTDRMFGILENRLQAKTAGGRRQDGAPRRAA